MGYMVTEPERWLLFVSQGQENTRSLDQVAMNMNENQKGPQSIERCYRQLRRLVLFTQGKGPLTLAFHCKDLLSQGDFFCVANFPSSLRLHQ
ncbi:hypothetical protein STEG23_005451, partial [Scotinomys teguina]